MPPTIHVTEHNGIYKCSGCTFAANENELIVVGDYWEPCHHASAKLPLQGFGSYSTHDYLELARKAVVERMRETYNESIVNTGVELLGIPKLVMRFKIK
jgi:hypothetical protein